MHVLSKITGQKKVLFFLIILFTQMAWAQIPTISAIPDQAGFPGDSICTNVQLTNIGPSGFGPYLRLIVEPGLVLDSASLFGGNIPITDLGVFSYPPNDQITDPLISDVVTGPVGATLLLLELPIGSIVYGGPVLNINICFTIDINALIGSPINVLVTPIFEFGDTPLGINGPIIGSDIEFNVIPKLMNFNKSSTAPDSGTPPGPSWPVSYTLTADIAPFKTLTNVEIIDFLPTNFVINIPSISVSSGCLSSLTATTLTVICASVTGVDGTDIVVSYSGYYADVLDETTCSSSSAFNSASFDAVFGSNPIPSLFAAKTNHIEHLSIQKSASGSPLIPNGIVTFFITMQLSDFATVNSLQLQDILTDGYTYMVGSETFSNGSITANVIDNTPSNGATTLEFDITAINGDIAPGSGITLSYKATINSNYFNAEPILANDKLTNDVIATYSLMAGAINCNNSAAASIKIRSVIATKEIVVYGPIEPFRPGDIVTYSLSMEVPSGDTKDVVFIDFFPIPAFDATTISTNINLALNPQISLSYLDTLGLMPTSITTDAFDNSLTINWPDISSPIPVTLAVNVTVEITTEPYADKLVQSNILQVGTKNSDGIVSKSTTPLSIEIRAPKLVITKGVFSADQGQIIPMYFNGNLINADASDNVTFLITIDNQGGATAYDVIVTDPIVAGLTACSISSIVDGLGMPLPFYGTLSAGIFLTNPVLENDNSVGNPYNANVVNISYDCVLGTNVEVNEVIKNTVTASFTSIIGGTIFPIVKDDATVTIKEPTITKTIVDTAPDVDADDTTVTIGETIQYQVVVTIPEGVAVDLSLIDTLDFGLLFQSFDSISVTPGLITSHIDFSQVLTDTSGIGSAIATFPLDTITNTNTDNYSDETITIRYTVIVVDAAENVNGNVKNNLASIVFVDGSADANAPNVTIKEPNLIVSKTVFPIVADAGDTVTYTIMVQNTGTSPAFDIVVLDDLTDTFLNLLATTVNTSAGTVSIGNTSGDSTVQVDVPTIAIGETITITFDVLLGQNTPSGTNLINSVTVTDTSLPGGGRGYGPILTTALVNVTPASIMKTVIPASSTEQSGGASTLGDTSVVDLTIGEEVTFNITATLAEGVSPSVIITDTLPDNAGGHMQVVSASVVSVGANLTPTIVAPVANIILPNVVFFDFGSVINTADGLVTTADTIVVQVTAVVLDDAVNSGLETLVNNVIVQYNGGLDASASAMVEIVEPRMSVNKSSPVTTAGAGENITFSIVIDNLSANNSSANAFDVSLNDIIPAGFSYVAASLIQSSGPVADALIESSGIIQASWGQFDLASSVVINYQVTVDNAVVPQQSMTNIATIDWSSLPTANINERNNMDAEGHTITISEPGVVKLVFATSESSSGSLVNGVEEDILIGEEVTYRFTVFIPEGNSNATSVVDQLPTVSTIMDVVSSRIISIGSQLSFTTTTVVVGQSGVVVDTDLDNYNDNVVWVLGDIFNVADGNDDANDKIVFEVVARLVDEAVNQNGGNDIINTVTLTKGGSTLEGTALIDIIEPIINVTKTTIPVAITADAGDTLDYQITITHDALSNADAFNLTVSDILPTPGSNWINDATVSSTCGAITIDSSAAPVIVFAFNELLLSTSSCRINYQLIVDIGVNPNENYQNTVEVSYTSTAVINTQTRTSTDMDSSSFITPDPAIVKISTSSSLADTGDNIQDMLLPDLAIGEVIDFKLTIIFPEGTTSNSIVIDQLPQGVNGILEMVSATVDSIGANLTATLAAVPVISNTDADIYNDMVTLDFGTMVNLPDGMVDTNDQISITVTAKVVDEVVNTDLDTLTNTATFTSDFGVLLSDSADIEIVEPNLSLSKSMGPMSDQLIAVTLSLSNTGNASAYDIEIIDVIDTSIWDVASITVGTTPLGFIFATNPGPAANQLTLSYRSNPGMSPPDTSIEPSEVLLFGFNIGLRSDVILPTTLNNTASLTQASTLPGADPDERDLPNIDATTVLAIPVLDSDKSVTLVNDDNGSGGASPSEVLEYTIIVTNTGDGVANNVRVVDVPDANVTLNIGSVMTTVGTVTIGNTIGDTVVDIVVGSIPAQSSVMIVYQVTINDSLASGITELINQGLIESDETPDFFTDDPSTGKIDDPTVIAVDAVPDLLVIKDDGGVSATAGDSVIYTLSYMNVGSQDATGVLITDIVPANSRFDPAFSDSMWVCAPDNNAGSICTNIIGNVTANGGAGNIDFAIIVDNPLATGVTDLINMASIADNGANGIDPTPADNSSVDTTPITAAPDMAIIKTDNNISILPGETIIYDITYDNVGSQNAAAVVITEVVPVNTTFNAGLSHAAWACAPNANAGSICRLSIANVNVGAAALIQFAVDTDNPLAVGVHEISNVVSIADDGTNGVDPNMTNNSDSELTPVGGSPDLAITKTDNDVTTGPGQTVTYILSYQNLGNQSATGVVINETVPVHTSFNANASTGVWTCLPDNLATSTCQYMVGALVVGETGSINFAIDVDQPLATGINLIINNVNISDDGLNGNDTNPQNNNATDDTPLLLEPPVGGKIGEFDADDQRVIHWTFWWFNPNNSQDLPVYIFDDIPDGTSFAGNVICTASGSSSCNAPTFNVGLNRIELNAIISEDEGAPFNSLPGQLDNVIVIRFDVRVDGSGPLSIVNQAMSNWDGNNDGSASDDANSGQTPIPTDDPVTSPINDPTLLIRAFPIPGFGIWALLLLIFVILFIYKFKVLLVKLVP